MDGTAKNVKMKSGKRNSRNSKDAVSADWHFALREWADGAGRVPRDAAREEQPYV